MSNSYEAKDGSSARVIAAILAIVTLVVGGALLTMLGSQLLHGSNPSLLLIIVAIILAGVGRVLLELVGGAVLELIFSPVLSLFTRFVPKSSQERLNRVVGGPWLLLTILVLAVLGILAIALWFAG